MKKLLLITISATALLNSCSQTGSNEMANAHHQEMKLLIGNYDKATNLRTNDLDQKINTQILQINELNKQVKLLQNSLTGTQQKVNNLGSMQNKDSIEAVISLSKLNHSNVTRNLYSILGEIKGKSAEAAILLILENESDPNNVDYALRALKSVNSKKIKATCLALLSSGEPATMRYALEHLKNYLTEKDTAALLKVAELIPPNSREYNVRYCWQTLFKSLLEIGNEKSVEVALKTLKKFNKTSNNPAGWAALVVARYGTDEQSKQAVKILLPLFKGQSSLNSDFSYWFKDNAHIKVVPVMQAMESKASGSYKRYIYEGYISLDHPSLASHLLNEYKNGKDSSTKSLLAKAFAEDYAGIDWDKNGKKATLTLVKSIK
ncbi:MAG: hypothetical protein HRT88_22580 [Lentisphaeraceae bacterium]|nr:hypothetical protein [Lentisphaeraceae bacterium]